MRKVHALVAVLGSALLGAAGPASAQLLADDHMGGITVNNTGDLSGGLITLNTLTVDYGYQEWIRGSCTGFSAGSAVVVSGTTATYTADCGLFDVAATIRLLSPLPSAPLLSGGIERQFVFTNPTGVPQPLDVILEIDQDLASPVTTDFAGREPISGALFTINTGVVPGVQAVTYASTDQAGAVAGFDVGPLGTASTSFPMDNFAGPVGPDDVETSIGFQMTVPGLASATVRFRTMYLHNPTVIPADFDFSSCYTTPPASYCGDGAKGQLLIKDNATDNKDKLQWKYLQGVETVQADFGDPTVDGTYSLCVYDGNGDQFTSVHVPESSTMWSALSDKGYKFTDKTGSGSGITKSQLKGGAAGKSKVLLGGSGENLPDPTLGTIATPITVQYHAGGNPGTCWETTLSTVPKNDATQLKAKAP